jgi:SAM-dependent methyltransferase
MSEAIDTEATPAPEGVPPRPFAAEEILALHSIPLFGINGFSVNGGLLEVAGLALPVKGNPRTVEFSADPGVEFAVEYPIPHAGAAEYYWYWPGSELSAFRLRVDLAASRTAGDYYKFRLRFAGGGKRPLESIRTTIVVPKNIGLLENFPTPAALRRVQSFETVNSVATTGLTDALRICELARAYGWDGTGDVLDWGVGHGRVARHIGRFSEANVFGVDIDPDNIAWANAHLPSLSVSVGPLMPPTSYPDNQFSLVYGISVMTHLERSVQEAWLEEIKRILRPGGIALLTFAGNASLAFSSKDLDRAFLDTYLETGFGPHLTSHDLVGVIDTPEYYKNVKQTIERAKEICSGFLEVAGAHECMFGYQDLLVLRKPSPAGGESPPARPSVRSSAAKGAYVPGSQNVPDEEAVYAALDARIREAIERDPAIAPRKLRRQFGIDPQTLNQAMRRIKGLAPAGKVRRTSTDDPTLPERIRQAFERNPNLSARELRKEVGAVGRGFAEALRASGVQVGKPAKGPTGPAQPLSAELERRVREALATNPDIELRTLASLLGMDRRELARSLRKSGLPVNREGKPKAQADPPVSE